LAEWQCKLLVWEIWKNKNVSKLTEMRIMKAMVFQSDNASYLYGKYGRIKTRVS